MKTRIQPKAKGREPIHNACIPSIWRKVENIATWVGCSKAYVVTILLAHALGIDLGDDYDLARKIRSYCK